MTVAGLIYKVTEVLMLNQIFVSTENRGKNSGSDQPKTGKNGINGGS